jgi:hypothetical protein
MFHHQWPLRMQQQVTYHRLLSLEPQLEFQEQYHQRQHQPLKRYQGYQLLTLHYQ